MRTAALALAGLALVVATAAAVALAFPAVPADRAQRLAEQLRCPDCQALSVAESRTTAAAAIREEIGVQVAAGRSDDEIRGHFVERYGEWILLAPSDPLAWWLPIGAVALGVAAFVTWLLMGRSGRAVGGASPPRLPEDERRRIGEELEALDG